MKIISPKGLELLKQFEGCRLVAYRCPAGVLTIGYGHTGSDVMAGERISQMMADELLRCDLLHYEQMVLDLVAIPLTQPQFDALVCITYNIGGKAFAESTLLKYVNQGNILEASNQFLKWNKIKGKVSKGLTERRKQERELFLS